MTGMNNQFFSFDNGELYVHNSDDVPRNNFYGVQNSSKLSLMVNDSPSDVKELQAVSLEGDSSWDATIVAYKSGVDDATTSTIASTEFVKKEGLWYAYARRNEDAGNYDSKSSYGIGVIFDMIGNDISVMIGSTSLSYGDSIVNATDMTTVGTITAISTVGNVVTISLTDVGTLTIGDFIVGKKNTRVEGGNLRGYNLRMDLTNSNTGKLELFAVNSEIIRSFP